MLCKTKPSLKWLLLLASVSLGIAAIARPASAAASSSKSDPSEDPSAGLAHLWDWKAISKEPLDVEIVSSTTQDGYQAQGIYLNGVGDAAGKDRIFFYYAHPEVATGRIPAVIDLTGGSPDPARAIYFAKVFKSASVVMEWRCVAAKLKSKWVGGPPVYRGTGPLKSDQAYRVVSGARRILDFLCEQNYIDPSRLASLGGSMGGIYTLLLAGVDSRVSAGVVDVGVGHLANSDCAQGVFHLSPERKALWLKAFDPYSHVSNIRAKIICLPSSSDHFCALGDIVETYKAIPTEKRIAIDSNFDHSTPPFGGEPHYAGLVEWLPYCFGQTPSYLKIPEVLEQKDNTYWIVTNNTEIKQAILYWSPGGKDLIWPARYWARVDATVKDGKCTAEIPAPYASLPMVVYMNVYNSKGQKASTLPVFREGTIAPLLWDNGQPWDTKAGPAAWRPVVAGADISRKANIQSAPPDGLIVGPVADAPGKKFVILTNSVGLAAAAAEKHSGLSLTIDGAGAAGELKISLVRNFNSALKTEEQFVYTVKYDKGLQTYSIPWSDFANAAAPGASLFPFDTLQLEGARPDGSPITIRSIGFAVN
jgi:hypothetical protein